MTGGGDGLWVADLERRLSILTDRDLTRRLVTVYPALYPRLHARRRRIADAPFVVFPAAPRERVRVVRALIIATLVSAIGAACLYAAAQERLARRPTLTLWAHAVACSRAVDHSVTERAGGCPCST